MMFKNEEERVKAYNEFSSRKYWQYTLMCKSCQKNVSKGWLLKKDYSHNEFYNFCINRDEEFEECDTCQRITKHELVSLDLNYV